MDWFKKHVDTLAIITAIVSSMMWMNGKFSELEKDIGGLKTEVAIIKTVLVMQRIMPSELAQKDHNEKEFITK